MMQSRFKNLTLLNIAGQKIQWSSSARPTILEFTSCETCMEDLEELLLSLNRPIEE